jgi:hypothetical protein
MKPFRLIAPFFILIALAGCRSRVITVNLINISTEPIKTIIVDYPTATFGKDALAPGATFSYAIKPLETGRLKLRFTDAQGAIHSYEGVALQQNDEGSVTIKMTQSSADVRYDIARGKNHIVQ